MTNFPGQGITLILLQDTDHLRDVEEHKWKRFLMGRKGLRILEANRVTGGGVHTRTQHIMVTNTDLKNQTNKIIIPGSLRAMCPDARIRGIS